MEYDIRKTYFATKIENDEKQYLIIHDTDNNRAMTDNNNRAVKVYEVLLTTGDKNRIAVGLFELELVAGVIDNDMFPFLNFYENYELSKRKMLKLLKEYLLDFDKTIVSEQIKK